MCLHLSKEGSLIQVNRISSSSYQCNAVTLPSCSQRLIWTRIYSSHRQHGGEVHRHLHRHDSEFGLPLPSFLLHLHIPSSLLPLLPLFLFPIPPFFSSSSHLFLLPLPLPPLSSLLLLLLLLFVPPPKNVPRYNVTV